MLAPTVDQIVSIKRIARTLNLSPATILKMSARGAFPKPVDIGVRKKLYLLSHIETWWKERLGGQSEPFPLAPELPGDADDDGAD